MGTESLYFQYYQIQIPAQGISGVWDIKTIGDLEGIIGNWEKGEGELGEVKNRKRICPCSSTLKHMSKLNLMTAEQRRFRDI